MIECYRWRVPGNYASPEPPARGAQAPVAATPCRRCLSAQSQLVRRPSHGPSESVPPRHVAPLVPRVYGEAARIGIPR